MEFLDLTARRFSTLHYTGEPISQEVLEQVLRAGQLAPTACNFQPQRIWVFTEPEARKKIQEVTHSSLPFPAALLVCYDETACWRRPTDGKLSGEIDASIVATHMMLAATDLGLGSIWVMSWDPEQMCRAFELPEHTVPVALLILGYPAPDERPRPTHLSRKELAETVRFETA